MKLNHHPDADSLYIDLSDRPSVESREVFEGVVLDYDSSGRLGGIDIDNAANKVELQKTNPLQASRQDPNRRSLKSPRGLLLRGRKELLADPEVSKTCNSSQPGQY